ncbi:MAG: tRNA (guanosine(46)-N7)-methyltransferase TrmB [Bacteroidales bacterium]|nr:tRNA (guanosine(46)-N7)-methyltransferase TrmB [Bacteroidales bacterium]
MGHGKLKKFAENETFKCLLQPSASDVLADGFFNLRDHEVKGHWNDTMFDAPRPVVLELGCGKGEYTIDLAQRNPSCNYIGVDIKGARLWKGAKYATEHHLGNVAFLRTRIEFITAYFAPGEVSEIWLTFSDPQFRSENSRLTSPLFLDRYRSFLKPGGIVHLKTDSMFLHKYSRAVADANGLRVLGCTEDLYATPREAFALSAEEGPCLSRAEGGTSLQDPTPPSLPSETVGALYEVQTFYEKMFLEQGYKITYLSFVIDHDGPYVHPDFDEDYWRSVEGPRLLFGHDSAETRRQKLHSSDEAI